MRPTCRPAPPWRPGLPRTRTPRAPIILRLARDVLTVAEPVLRSSPQLAPADLDAIARERGPAYAAIIAERTSSQSAPRPSAQPPARPSQPQRQTPPQRPYHQPNRRPAVVSAAVNANTPNMKPDMQPDMTRDLTPAFEAKELCGLFFAADSLERRLILISLEFLPTPPPALPMAMQQADIWRFESSALQHKTEAVLRELERALASRAGRRRASWRMTAASRSWPLPRQWSCRRRAAADPAVHESARIGNRSIGSMSSRRSMPRSRRAALRLIAILRDADPPRCAPASITARDGRAVPHAEYAAVPTHGASASSERPAPGTAVAEGS